MTWHALVRIGSSDGYDPSLGPTEPRIHIAFERNGDPWLLSNNVLRRIEERSGTLPNGAAVDLLYLAMSVYAADLRIPRRFASDQWCREVELHLAVSDLALWSQHAVHVEQMLNFLTGDHWTLRLRGREEPERPSSNLQLNDVQAVCLFSGGLDSLVGAIDLLSEGKSVALVGHHGAGVTNPVQSRVLAAVGQKYSASMFPFMFYVQPPRGNANEGEPSMRSRSFLFFAMGIAVVNALGRPIPLVVAENGLISLNVPLTHARSGSRSTRTTHPHYVALFAELLQRVGLPAVIEMPYRFSTKGEMLRECKDQGLLAETAKLTMSCSHPEAGRFRGFSPNNHCGYCVPCIIRKAATKAVCLADATYNIPIETEAPPHTTEAGRDYRAFLMALERDSGLTASQATFRILSSGPLPSEEMTALAGLYVRGMDEVRALIGTGKV